MGIGAYMAIAGNPRSVVAVGINSSRAVASVCSCGVFYVGRRSLGAPPNMLINLETWER